MEDNIRDYARLGFVHHMLYPESFKDEDLHFSTLMEFVGRDDIETFDCYLPFDADRRKELAKRIKSCEKEVVYAFCVFPAQKLSLGSLLPNERGIAKLMMKDQIEVAAAIGAKGFVFSSGADVPQNREEAKKHFIEFCLCFCRELEPYGIKAMLEPFDREVDKRCLLGPIDECIEIIKRLKTEVDNICIELDFAHLPLMGESFEQAVRKAVPYIERVHLGNCVLKDKAHPLFGDHHPPVGLQGGEIDVPELTGILESLLSIGYLNKDHRGALLYEITPFPGKSVEFTIKDNMDRLNKAWSMVR